MAAAIPTAISQTALLAGEPVKKRDTPELNDLETLTPQIINKTPMASNTTEMTLIILTPLLS